MVGRFVAFAGAAGFGPSKDATIFFGAIARSLSALRESERPLCAILASMGTPRVSGAIMLDQLRVLEERTSPEIVREALASLPPEHRAQLEAVMPVSWLDIDACNGLFVAVARAIGRDPEELQAEIARIGVERTLHGMWRVLLRFTTDAALVARTPLLYSKTYDAGTLRGRIDTPGVCHVELEGWPDPPKLELIGLAAGIEAVLRCAGRKDVSVRFERRPNGAVFLGSWKV